MLRTYEKLHGRELGFPHYVGMLGWFKCVGMLDWQELAKNIKESIFIRVNNPTLNKNIGKFNLPHICDRVLLILLVLP